jgi:tetratricopeptide (TPR) repeat protein
MIGVHMRHTLRLTLTVLVTFSLHIRANVLTPLEEAGNFQYLAPLTVQPLIIAQDAIRLGRVDQAEALLESFLADNEANKSNAAAWELLGIVSALRGNAKASIIAFDTAIKLAPDAPVPIVRAGIVEWSQGRLKQAESRFTSALNLSPSNDFALSNLSRFYDYQSRFDDVIALLEPQQSTLSEETLYLLASALTQTGQSKKAEDTVTLLRALAPDNTGPEILDGILARMSGDLDASKRHLRSAIKRQPGNDALKLQLARTLAADGEYDKAIALLQGTLGGQTDISVVMEEIALVQLAQGKPIDAIHTLDQSIEATNSARSFTMKTEIQRDKQQDLSAALRTASEYRREYPDQETPYLMLAGMMEMAGNKDGAKKVLRDGLEHVVGSIALPYQLAVRLHRAGDTATAIKMYEMVLRLDPTHVASLNNSADIQANDGDLQVAKMLASRAFALAPESKSVADTLGWIYFLSGELNIAHKHLLGAFNGKANRTITCHLALTEAALSLTSAKDRLGECLVMTNVADEISNLAERALQALP